MSPIPKGSPLRKLALRYRITLSHGGRRKQWLSEEELGAKINLAKHAKHTKPKLMKSIVKPIIKPTAKPTSKPISKPTIKPVTKPITKITKSTVTAKQSTAMSAALSIHQIYDRGYAFPVWSLHTKPGRAMVLYHEGADATAVKRLATEREPVNIAMHRQYNQAQLTKNFGWSLGYYRNSTAKKLEPNIAVVTTTPFSSVAQDGTEITTKPRGRVAKVHVVNLVGYAFDSPRQPDALYFKITPGKLASLLDAYTDVWKLGFWACHEWFPMEVTPRLMTAEVGSGAFRPHFMSESDFRTQIHNPAVASAQRWIQKMTGRTIETAPMGFIPAAIFNLSTTELKRTMFVNAWDPWSMLGNGNAADGSLDGMWGRHSAVAVTGWPLSNPNIQYRAVPLS
jgi:hypothetical protein